MAYDQTGKSLTEYNELVLDYLEEIGFPDLILDYTPESVAPTISQSIRAFYDIRESHRMCALVIFGLTMTLRVIPAAKKMTVQ